MRVHICTLGLPGVDCRVQKVVLDREPQTTGNPSEERDPYWRVHTSTPRVYRLFIITLHQVYGQTQRHYRSPVPYRLEETLTSDYRQSRLTSVLSDITSSHSRGLLNRSVTKMMLVYYCYVDEDTKDSGMVKWHLSENPDLWIHKVPTRRDHTQIRTTSPLETRFR